MKKLILIILLFAPQLAMAANPGWQGYMKPVELLFEGNDDGSRVYVTFSESLALAECSGGGAYIRVHGKTKRGEYMISVILAAIAAGKNVSPNISGCDDWNRPILKGIRIGR
ncbi:hypothetical protein FLL45_00375 [Aliikangiella marina]|uniref:Uncharacterized protein n=1 Tax=Aliikangiella marina TaxID=1712262 RepID=A0A545TGY4_9GAMM|nr:hypothetical protein [Aliikangiella marina]TQV76456.1 hypothetical protein FLL45_00375 [Aliikangiella marina]